MHQQEVRGVSLLTFHIGNTGSHRHSGNTGGADEGIDLALGQLVHQDAYQQTAGRVGRPQDIADMVLYLCSDKASFITGENITIDGGMTKLMIYHNDNGWNLSL